jgi:hypothetical protein
MALEKHLEPKPECKAPALDMCRASACAGVVKRNPESGRWFITLGHAGFNLPANNRSGYASQARALAAHERCAR